MNNFNTEFRTILDRHRVCYSCRDAFPVERVWKVAEEICLLVSKNSDLGRLTHIFQDDRNGIINFTVRTTDEMEAKALRLVLGDGVVMEDGNSIVDVEVIPKRGNEQSNNYCHTAYLFHYSKD